MRKMALTLVAGVLLTVATSIVFIPEVRTLPMRITLLVMWAITVGSNFWYLHRAGALGMTPKQIYNMETKPKFSILHAAAIAMGVAAIMASAP